MLRNWKELSRQHAFDFILSSKIRPQESRGKCWKYVFNNKPLGLKCDSWIIRYKDHSSWFKGTFDSWKNWFKIMTGNQSEVVLSWRLSSMVGKRRVISVLRGAMLSMGKKQMPWETVVIAAFDVQVSIGLFRISTSKCGRHKQDDWTSKKELDDGVSASNTGAGS